MKTNIVPMTVSEAIWITLTRCYKVNNIARKLIADKGYIIETKTEKNRNKRKMTYVFAIKNPKTGKYIKANNVPTKYRRHDKKSDWYGIILYPNYDYYHWGQDEKHQRIRESNFLINDETRICHDNLETFLDTPINTEYIDFLNMRQKESYSTKHKYSDLINAKDYLEIRKKCQETLKADIATIADSIEKNTLEIYRTQNKINQIRIKLGLQTKNYA